ncbi:hypothetical protein DHEL01_v205277 [Diaporthe helianthi]|uniref:Uncharacterized protein n=1 Tax=Diaporthe helianthi TaxID=158607 RepID=A0A2P5I1F9_DIAHE|nr:hypothetical protein DHEL01_v205277 [Diaporthe helianthi]
MASTADVYRPNHPPPSVSSTINSGSDGSDRPTRHRHARSPSYDSDDQNDVFSLIIHRTDDEISDFMREQRLLQTNQGDTVSHPISPDSHFSQGNSAPGSSEDADMTEEEFFAQLGMEVPAWAKQPLEAAPQVQVDGSGDDDFMEVSTDDLEAQLSAEITAVPGSDDDDDDDIMELSAEDFAAQLNARTAPDLDDDDDDDDAAREAELDAEIGAEPVVDHAAIAAKRRAVRRRRKARKDRYRKRRAPGKEGRRSAFKTWSTHVKNEVRRLRLDQGDNLTAPTTEELMTELDTELPGDDLIDLTTEDLEAELDAELAGGDNLTELPTEDLEAELDAELAGQTSAAGAVARPSDNSNGALSVKWMSCFSLDHTELGTSFKIRRLKLARKRATNNHGPLRQRLGRNKPPPMRTIGTLPKVYHHQSPIDWTPLRKAITLSTRVDLSTCYKALGLDPGRGKAVYEDLKAYLRIPGNSVNLSSENVDPNNAKRVVAKIAHRLLTSGGWGLKYFNRPSLTSGCKYIPFEANSTEVFLEFTSLVYKAMKLEEKRKKGRAKTQEIKEANAVVNHEPSQNVAATTYLSPRAVVPRSVALPPRGVVNPVWAALGLV